MPTELLVFFFFGGASGTAVDTDLGLVVATIRAYPTLSASVAAAPAVTGSPAAVPAVSATPQINEVDA